MGTTPRSLGYSRGLPSAGVAVGKARVEVWNIVTRRPSGNNHLQHQTDDQRESGMPVKGERILQLGRKHIGESYVRSEERRVGKSVDLGGRRIIKKKKK